ncbi:MAG: glycosyltransferase family 2 protein [Candidatus Gracilibacteria bacterium]
MNYRIIAPVYNEEKYIKAFLDSFPEKHLTSLILVDDGSIDKTEQIVKENYPKIAYLKHKINLGKGKSLETGSLKAIEQKADIIIVMDSDMQHKTEDIDRFLDVFQKNPDTKIVFGARKIGKTMPLIAFIGNKMISVITNLLFHYFVNDTQCGFRAFKSDIFNKIRWNSHGYSVETEMIINAAFHKLKYQEITIETIYLEKYKGMNVFDGMTVLFKILGWRISKLFK